MAFSCRLVVDKCMVLKNEKKRRKMKRSSPDPHFICFKIIFLHIHRISSGNPICKGSLCFHIWPQWEKEKAGSYFKGLLSKLLRIMIQDGTVHIRSFSWPCSMAWVWWDNPAQFQGSSWRNVLGFMWSCNLYSTCVSQEWELLSGFCSACNHKACNSLQMKALTKLGFRKPLNREWVLLLLRSFPAPGRAQAQIPGRPVCSYS